MTPVFVTALSAMTFVCSSPLENSLAQIALYVSYQDYYYLNHLTALAAPCTGLWPHFPHLTIAVKHPRRYHQDYNLVSIYLLLNKYLSIAIIY